MLYTGDFYGHRIAHTQEIVIPEGQEQESDINFETGVEVGKEEQLTQLEDRLLDEGFPPDEVDELLYDPAPRRRGRKRRRHSRRTYDPAPRRRSSGRRTTARHYRKKGTLSKLKKFVLPATAGMTFYSAYTKRATDLFNQGLISSNSVYDAIMYDINNFDSTAAMTRLQDQAGNIATPLIGGWAIQETKLLGKYSGIVADILYGLGIGTGAKAILDPPIGNRSAATNRSRVIRRAGTPGTSVAPADTGCPTCDQPAQATTNGYNPYMPGRY